MIQWIDPVTLTHNQVGVNPRDTRRKDATGHYIEVPWILGIHRPVGRPASRSRQHPFFHGPKARSDFPQSGRAFFLRLAGAGSHAIVIGVSTALVMALAAQIGPQEAW